MESQACPRFLIRNWPDGAVVFDRRFGDTHSLNRLTAAVFQLTQGAQVNSLEEITARLVDEFAEHVGPDPSSAVNLAFEQLVSCRLIQGQS